MKRYKRFKVGDLVTAVFLGTAYDCEVIEITDKHLYKLRTSDGTILPSVTWPDLMKKNSPWYLVKKTGHKESKVIKKDNIQKTDLDKAIAKQKKFLRGEIND